MRIVPAVCGLVFCGAALLAHGCSDEPDVGAGPAETGPEPVGAEGREVKLGDKVTLIIPPGALDAEVEIRITELEDVEPEFLVPVSPVYRFEPAGLQFAKPATVRLAYDPEVLEAPAAEADIGLFWAEAGGTFAALPSELDTAARSVRAQTTHLSDWVAAVPAEDGVVCCKQVDVYLVVAATECEAAAVQEPARCEQVCCALPGGDHEPAILAGHCLDAGGTVAPNADCDEVCCLEGGVATLEAAAACVGPGAEVVDYAACGDAECVTAADCPPGGACKEAACNLVTFECYTIATSGGTTCDDGDPCTIGDHCANQVCVAGAPRSCETDSPCLAGSCDPAAGGCVTTPVVGVPCDNGDPCTEGDVCDEAGHCSGTPKLCDAPADPQCAALDGWCDLDTGACEYPTYEDGTPCDDGDPCTAGDQCSGGTCAAGAPLDCDDGDPCTASACAADGCAHTPAEGPACDDGDPCTDGDTCGPEGCAGTPSADPACQ